MAKHFIEEDWLDIAVRATKGRDDFEANFPDLPGKVKHLLKHMDPRSKSSRNLSKDLAKFSEGEQKTLNQLLKYHQAFPLNHKFKKNRHASKYQGKSSGKNHLIDANMMKNFDKRNA